MSHLVPCPECSRHVRVTEAACPFCSLPLDLADTPAPVMPGQRLSRAATLAFGATLASATALAACGSTVPVYGAPGPGPVAGAAGEESSGGASGNAGSTASDGGATAGPVYGAPAAGSANNDAGASSSAGGGQVPVYGAPPPQDD